MITSKGAGNMPAFFLVKKEGKKEW